MKNNYYIVYMPRVAAALRTLGFKIEKVTPNEKKPQYDVYWFKNSAELQDAMPVAVKMAKR